MTAKWGGAQGAKCFVHKDLRGWYSVGTYSDDQVPYFGEIVFESDRADDCVSYISAQLRRDDRRFDRSHHIVTAVILLAIVFVMVTLIF